MGSHSPCHEPKNNIESISSITRIMLEHLSGGASMKRRGKRKREKKKREKKKRGRKKEGEKKDGGKKEEEKKRCSTGNQTQDFPHGRSKL